MQLKDSTGKVIGDGTSILVNAPYAAKITGVAVPANAVVTWNATSTVTDGAHAHPGATPTEAELHCESPSAVTLSVQVVVGSNTYNSRTMNFTCIANPLPTPTPPPSASMVEFHIPAGTGSAPWNTAATSVKVYVGQTLRIINDDTTVHRMHTGGNPCPHQPANSATGGFYDCVIASAVVSTAGNPTYDHNIGTAARVYIDAFNGNTQYATSCQSCHGPLATSEVRNRTAAQINTAIATQPQMNNITLSADLINAISYSLNH